MNVEKMINKVWLWLLALILICLPLYSRLIPQKTEAAEERPPNEFFLLDDESAPSSLFENSEKAVELSSGLERVSPMIGSEEHNRKLILNGSDLEAIKAGKVDERLLKTLIYLVTPKELGGAGHQRIKVGRLMKGYKTEKKSLSKESIFEKGEEPNVSAHSTGQAVDITEIDSLKCKIVKRSHWGDITGTNKTERQPPAPIKVMYQTEKGATEAVPGFYGENLNALAFNLSKEAILYALNENFEGCDLSNLELKDVSLTDIVKYIGIFIILEEFDLEEVEIGGDFETNLENIGRAILAKYLDLPAEGLRGNDKEEILLNLGKAILEKKLGLEPGSLEGGSLSEIFKNAGKRRTEKDLGLRRGSLDGEIKDLKEKIGQAKIEETLDLKKDSFAPDNLAEIKNRVGKERFELTFKNPEMIDDWLSIKRGKTKEFLEGKLSPSDYKKTVGDEYLKATLLYYTQADSAFDYPSGTIDSLTKNEGKAFYIVGASVVSEALNLDKAQKASLIAQAQAGNFDFTIKFEGITLQSDLKDEDLENLFGRDEKKRKEAFKKAGERLFDEALNKASTDLQLGLTKEDIKKLKEDRIKIYELAQKIGARKLEYELDLPLNSIYYTLKEKKTENLVKNIGRASVEEEGKKASAYKDSELIEIGQRILNEKAAFYLNQTLNLKGSYALTGEDVKMLLEGQWFSVALKIGGINLEDILVIPFGGILEIIENKKSPMDVLKEAGAIRLGQVAGLKRPVPITGNIKENLGQIQVEENLGLKENSFKGSIDEVKAKNGTERFNVVFKKPEEIDFLFGLEKGTTTSLLEGKISVTDYSKKVGEVLIRDITVDEIADYFELDKKMFEIEVTVPGTWPPQKKKVNQLGLALETIKNWDKAKDEDRALVFDSFFKLAGYDWDSKIGWDKGTFSKILANPKDAKEIILEQGMKILSRNLNLKETVILNIYKDGKIDLIDAAIPKIKEVTKIPNDEDARRFLTGDIKGGFICWGLASTLEYINKYLPSDAQLTYGEAKAAYFGDDKKIDEETDKLIKEQNLTVSPEQREEIRITVRKDQIERARRNMSYKVTDSFLRKTDSNIPVGFTRAMLEGSDEEKTNILLAYFENSLRSGKIAGAQIDLPEGTLAALNNYFKTKDLDTLYKTGALSAFDNFVTKNSENWFGFRFQPGTAEALFAYHKTGSLDKDYISGDIKIKSLKNVYKDWATYKISSWLDKKINLPAGSAYKIYQATKAYLRALEAYKNAKAAYEAVKTAENLEKLNSANEGVKTVKADLTDLALQIGWELCENCQEWALDADKQFALPPGTTSMFVSGLIRFFTAGDPSGIVIAAVYSIFGTYRIDYLCPCPPETDLYIKKAPKMSVYPLAASSLTITSVFARSMENISGWCDGREPNLWMAWSRYKVKQLLGDLLEMPKKLNDKNQKPLQIMTLREEDVRIYEAKLNELYGLVKERLRTGMWPNELMWDRIHLGY